MDIKTTLSQITDKDFKTYPAWMATGNYVEDDDAELVPINFTVVPRFTTSLARRGIVISEDGVDKT